MGQPGLFLPKIIKLIRGFTTKNEHPDGGGQPGMETYTPHARYSFLVETGNGWKVEQIAVPYDWDSTAEILKNNGRPDWFKWLKTGRAS